MPELPEVEVVRRGLETHLVAGRITAVEVLDPRSVRQDCGGVEGFIALTAGRVVSSIERRGKYLWCVLDDVDAMIIHLGMSGQCRIHRPEDELHRHTRVVFSLNSGAELRFIDQRIFGYLSVVADGWACPVPHIAPDPFSPDFDLAKVSAKLRAKKTTLKRALLDQRLISGIGNIYADETLWRCKAHYDQPTDSLSAPMATKLLAQAHRVMADALSAGGTSFDSLYVNVNGESGYFARELAVYGRADLPCHRCGTPIVRERFMNRSSYLCPRCQPRRPRA